MCSPVNRRAQEWRSSRMAAMAVPSCGARQGGRAGLIMWVNKQQSRQLSVPWLAHQRQRDGDRNPGGAPRNPGAAGTQRVGHARGAGHGVAGDPHPHDACTRRCTQASSRPPRWQQLHRRHGARQLSPAAARWGCAPRRRTAGVDGDAHDSHRYVGVGHPAAHENHDLPGGGKGCHVDEEARGATPQRHPGAPAGQGAGPQAAGWPGTARGAAAAVERRRARSSSPQRSTTHSRS